MKDLQAATEKICDLKGSQMALHTFVKALISVLPAEAIEPLKRALAEEQEICSTVLLNSLSSDRVHEALSRDLALYQDALAMRS